MILEAARYRIIDALLESFPEDVPDMRGSIDHLRPLNLPAQISVYRSETRERFGYKVRPG
jgi:hypothetical protein